MEFRPIPSRFVDQILQDPRLVFGLPSGATRAEITAAFRRLALAYHPDRSAPFLRESNAEVLCALCEARARLLAEASR